MNLLSLPIKLATGVFDIIYALTEHTSDPYFHEDPLLRQIATDLRAIRKVLQEQTSPVGGEASAGPSAGERPAESHLPAHDSAGQPNDVLCRMDARIWEGIASRANEGYVAYRQYCDE